MRKTYCDICNKDITNEEVQEFINDLPLRLPSCVLNIDDKDAPEWKFGGGDTYDDLCNDCRLILTSRINELIHKMKEDLMRSRDRK